MARLIVSRCVGRSFNLDTRVTTAYTGPAAGVRVATILAALHVKKATCQRGKLSLAFCPVGFLHFIFNRDGKLRIVK